MSGSWSPQQEEALRTVGRWIKSSGRQQVFRLFGYAGTGKTTLAQEIASMVRGTVLFGAFTGKAAMMLHKKGCRGASTIHSLIYKPEDDAFGEVSFILNPDSDVGTAKLVIIDEVSMVNEELARDLLSFGTPVLVLGDPAQLPPVSGAGYFTEAEPDIMLTEIHRQAAGNPIIELATKARKQERIAIGAYGETSVIRRSELSQRVVMGADQVIVGLNRTRTSVNAKIRALRGHESTIPEFGERLVCLKNWKDPYLLNGSLWMVRSAVKNGAFVVMDLDCEDGLPPVHEVEVLENFFLGTEDQLSAREKRFLPEFTYGYALTCHKSQGSQWDNIVVFNESNAFREDRHRWLYTAITRAAEKLTLVNGD